MTYSISEELKETGLNVYYLCFEKYETNVIIENAFYFLVTYKVKPEGGRVVSVIHNLRLNLIRQYAVRNINLESKAKHGSFPF